MILRPYQIEAKRNIYKAWLSFYYIMLQLATGGGKTITFVEIIKDAVQKQKKVYLIAHREELILQAHRTLEKKGVYAGIIKPEYPYRPEIPIQVGSIQTVIRRELEPPDIMIIDEAHHVKDNNTYGNLLSRWPNARVLMVTATPYRLDGSGFAILNNKPVKFIQSATLTDLINAGWLVPFKYMIGKVPNLEEIQIIRGEYEEKSSAKVMELAPVIESYKQHCDGLKGICYCVNIAHSKNVVKRYLNAGISAAHIDASTDTETRKKTLLKFVSGEIKIICNVGIITEGTDFPDCDFIQLLRPTKSLSMFLQMVGRGMRTLPGITKIEQTDIERKNAIAASKKPYCIILDNAGAFLDNGFPDDIKPWNEFFQGTYKTKKKKGNDEYIDIPVFTVKNQSGSIFQTRNIKEIENMQLVEVTSEIRKIVSKFNIKQEFDKVYNIMKRTRHVKQPGYTALNAWLTTLRRKGKRPNNDDWEYIYKRLVTEIELRIDTIKKMGFNDEKVLKTIQHIKTEGISKNAFNRIKMQYISTNAKSV